MLHERREGGRERSNTCSDTHRNCKDVIDQQRGGGYEARELAQVLPRDDVGAASARVRVDRLTVRIHDDGENRRDDGGYWTCEREGAYVDENQYAKNFFRRIRNRRERVRRQNGEPGYAGQPFVVGEVRRYWRADDEALELAEEPCFGHDLTSSKRPSGHPKNKKPQRAAAFDQ